MIAQAQALSFAVTPRVVRRTGSAAPAGRVPASKRVRE